VEIKMSEFDLIHKYFTWDNPPADIAIAVGDDAAVLDIPDGKQLVTSIDTLISGVHFPEDTSPKSIGHKALAVNLSDIAAMGATPKWFTLALTIPEINETWLNSFSKGLKSLAHQHNCFLIGGDTTCGPLSISIQVMGLVDKGRALLRSGAKIGDKIYVTGSLGDASAGLKNIQGNLKLSKQDSEYCQQRLNDPTPRLVESDFIKSFATSCIDISDGLLQDLSHVLQASQVGATLNLSELPLSLALKGLDSDIATNLVLTGGDDYELLFTIPINNESQFLDKIDHIVTCIGVITEEKLIILDEAGNHLTSSGYNHFHV
jgi:thiamine-monophosphate kinase